EYLVGLPAALARQPDLRPALASAVNTSLYPSTGRLRYLEVRRNGAGWTHHQVGLEAADYLEAVLARAQQGATPQALAAALLRAEPDAPQEDAEACIGELIDTQALVSARRPAVTGPEPIGPLGARLRDRAGPAAERLEQVRQELEALDAGGVGAGPGRYRHVTGLLQGLPGEINLARLF